MMSCIELLPKSTTYAFVQKHHYSQVLPRLTKICLGCRDDTGKLAAVCTLGYGVRPVHTIAKAFPGLGVKDYYEIGKLCLRDDMPKNSESWFLSRIVKWVKSEYPDIKLIYTWADGMLGKPGYIYQAANFFYGGYIVTETYLDGDGNRVHPRSMQGISEEAGSGKRNSRALSVTESMGYTKYWGKQFRYVYPLCDVKEWAAISSSSQFEWRRNSYPKSADCTWEIQTSSGRESISSFPFTSYKYGKHNKQQSSMSF